MAKKLHVGAGGAWTERKPSIGNGGAWNGGGVNGNMVGAWVGDGGAWKRYYELVVATPAISSVSALSTSSLRIVWGVVAGADGYRLERSPNGSTGWTEVYDGASTSFDDTGLTDGTQYFYRVQAYIGVTDSAWSATDSAYTTLKAPVFSSVGAVGETTAVLNYTDGGSAAETGIQVHVSTTGPSSGFSLHQTFAANSTQDTATSLTGDVQYWTKLRNTGPGGVSAFSVVRTLTTDEPLPGNVTDLVAVATCSGADLSWTDVSGEDGYRVFYRLSTSETWIKFGSDLPAGSTGVDVTGLASNTEYEFEVRPFNTSGEAGSNMVTKTTLDTPAAVTAGTPTDQGNSGIGEQVSFPWSGGAGATLFRVFRRVGGGGASTELGTIGSSPYSDSDLPSNLGQVSNVGFANVTDTSFDVSWTNPTDDATNIVVDRKVGGGGWSLAYKVLSATATGFSESGLSPSTTYEYRFRRRTKTVEGYEYGVRGENDCGNTATSWSSTVYPFEFGSAVTDSHATLALQKPTAPGNGDAIDQSTEFTPEIGVSWTDASDNEDGFKIHRSEDGGPFALHQTLATPGLESFDDTSVSFGTSYQYRVYSYNAAGDSTSYTQTPTVTPSSGGGGG